MERYNEAGKLILEAMTKGRRGDSTLIADLGTKS